MRVIRNNLDWRTWLLFVAFWLVCGFWLNGLAKRMFPASWQSWGVVVEMTASVDGAARLYYDEGEGISEEFALSRAVNAGRRTKLYFPLSERSVHGLRIDPIDQPGEVVLHRIALVAPFGRQLGDEKTLRLGAPVNASTEPAGADAVRIFSSSDDPHFYLKLKPKPFEVPSDDLAVAERVRVGVVCLIAALLAMGFTFGRRSVEIPLQGYLIIAGVGWAVAHYTLLVREIDRSWFFLGLAFPALILLVAKLGSGSSRRAFLEPRRTPGYVVTVAFFAYLGVLALVTGAPENPGGRSEVLSAVACIMLAVLLGPLVWLERFDRLRQGLVWFWLTAGAVAAVFAMWSYYHDFGYIGRRLVGVTALYRPVSGSAAYGLLLVIGLAVVISSNSGKAQRLRMLLLALICTVLVIYVLLSRSRGVVLALIVALLALGVLPRSRRSLIAVGLTFGVMAMFVFTSWPDRIFNAVWMATRPAEEAPIVEADLEGRASVGDGMMRGEPIRPKIYEVYFNEALKHPVFGHGFSAPQTLLVHAPDLPDEIRFDDGVDLGQSEWNPHSVPLAIFYYSGGLGLLLYLGMFTVLFLILARQAWNKRDSRAAMLAALLCYGAAATLLESTLVAYDKFPVALRYPNEYWLFLWGPVIMSAAYLVGDKKAGSALT